MKPQIMQDKVVVIGGWDDADSRSLRLQNFVANGESFIPIFSDEVAFKQQVQNYGDSAFNCGAPAQPAGSLPIKCTVTVIPHDGSKAKALKGGAFAFQVFRRVGLIDVVGFQKAVEFVT